MTKLVSTTITSTPDWLNWNLALSVKKTMDGSTRIGKIEVSAGGVGRNMADCLARVGADPLFISTVGEDENGVTALSKMRHMDTTGISVKQEIRTASYAVMLDIGGDCCFGIGDMNAHDHISTELVRKHEEAIAKAPMVVIDGNIPIQTMEYLFSVCSAHRIPVWFEPTDINKAGKLSKCSNREEVSIYASPNLKELLAMHNSLCHPPRNEIKVSDIDMNFRNTQSILRRCLQLSMPLMDHLLTIVVTLGPLGALLVTKEPKMELFRIAGANVLGVSKSRIRSVHYPALKPSKIVSVSGAGDCFAAAMVGAIVRGLDQDSCIQEAMRAAICSMASQDTVPCSISELMNTSHHQIHGLTPRDLDISNILSMETT